MNIFAEIAAEYAALENKSIDAVTLNIVSNLAEIQKNYPNLKIRFTTFISPELHFIEPDGTVHKCVCPDDIKPSGAYLSKVKPNVISIFDRIADHNCRFDRLHLDLTTN